MTDVSAYLQYFRNLANLHVNINDFYVMDINEPLNAMRSGMKFPALIMNTLEGSLAANNLDNVLDNIHGGFLIIDHLAKMDDFSGEMTILQHTKELGIDLISRMNYDLYKNEPAAMKAIQGFRYDSVTYQMVDGIFDNCFGFLFTYRLLSTMDLDYNPLKWHLLSESGT